MDLEKKVKNTNRILFAVAIGLVALFCLELLLLVLCEAGNIALVYTSNFIAFYGSISIFTIHAFFYKSKRTLLLKLLTSVGVRNLNLFPNQLEKVFTKDLYFYLRSVYVILPRFHTEGKKALSFSVDGLKDFAKNYQVYVDQNLTKEKKKEIIDSIKEFKFSPLDLIVGLVFFIFPLAIIGSDLGPSFYTSLVLILSCRAFTILFYWRLYKNSQVRGESSLRKLNVFINENLEEGDMTMETRIDFQSVLNAKANSIFMIVSEGRRSEVQKALRHIIINKEEFSDWFLILPNQEISLKNLKGKNLVLFFPCESKLTHKEALAMMEGASKVIVVDTNPGLALADSLVFYIDHDQRLKEVNASENIDRLSGDKGLILKNLQGSTNLEDFLSHVGERAKSNSAFYLVFKGLEDQDQEKLAKVFIFPSGEHAVYIQDQSPKSSSKEIFCKIEKEEPSTTKEKAKSFIANCTYHRMLKEKRKIAL